MKHVDEGTVNFLLFYLLIMLDKLFFNFSIYFDKA